MSTSPLIASVTVWCAPPIPCPPDVAHWLSTDEAAKASRFRQPVDHDRFVTGRLLSRAVLGGRLRVAPGDVDIRIGPRDGTAPGRPFVETGPSFSIAHAGSWVLVAVVDAATGPSRRGSGAAAIPEVGVDVGVDVESTAPARSHLAVLLDAVPPGERPAAGWDAESFTRSWVRREAVLKAVGTGLLAPRDDLLLTPADLPAGVVRSGGLLPAPDRLAVQDLDLDLATAPSAGRPSPSAGGDVTLGGSGRHPRGAQPSPSAGQPDTYLAAVALCSPHHPVALGVVTLADGVALLARHGVAVL